MQQAAPLIIVEPSTSGDEAGFDAASWAVLAAAIALFALGLAHLLYRLALPSDGWLRSGTEGGTAAYSASSYIFAVHPSDTPTPLQAGDVLAAIEGQPFQELFARASALQPRRPQQWLNGSVVRYTVLRDGHALALDVTLQPEPVSLLLSLDPEAGKVISLLVALLVLSVFLLRPRNQAARLLLLLFSAIGSAAPAPRVADMLDRAAFWPGVFFYEIIWVLLILPILMHLCLVFPVRKRVLRDHPHLVLGAIYGLMPGVYFVSIGLLRGLPGNPAPIYDAIGLGLIALAGLVMVSSIGHSFLTLRDPVGRAQLRWLAFGLLIGLGGPFIAFQLAVWLFPTSALPGFFASVLYLVFPLALGIAILRYRLWDIDIIINRTLVYSMLTGTLALVYIGSVVVLQAVVRSLTGEGRSQLVTVASTLAIVALFTPLRRRVQAFIDRRFYRRKYDIAKTLAAFGLHMRDEVGLDRLTGELLAVVEETMQPAHLSLWLTPANEHRGGE